MRYFAGFLLLQMWILGIIIATGFWSTAFAVVFAPWAWIVFWTEVLQYAGLL